MADTGNAPARCLSLWRLWQIARGLEEKVSREEDAHVASCARCKQLLAQEREDAAASATMPLPSYLRERLRAGTENAGRQSKPWYFLPGYIGGAAAAAALLVLLVLPKGSAPPQVRTKGNTSVNISLMRGGELIVHDVPFSSAPAMQADDRVRLRVLTPHPRVAVFAREGQNWSLLLEGEKPQDGWLPLGFRYTRGAPTLVRLVLCPNSVATPKQADTLPTGCERVQIEL